MKITINELYEVIRQEMGVQNWWITESPAEIICGAILIQNTNQKSVDKSLKNLRELTDFEPDKLLNLSEETLIEAIRPSGFYKNKSKAIRHFFEWLKAFDFKPDYISELYKTNIRSELLNIHGVGEETADVLAIYVFNQVEFVADSYARRLFNELGIPSASYKELKRKIKLDDTLLLLKRVSFMR